MKTINEETLCNLILQMYKSWFSSPEQIIEAFQTVNLNPAPFLAYFQYHQKQSQSFNPEDIKALKQNLLIQRKICLNSKLNLFIAANTVLITLFPEIIYSLLLQTPIICRVPDPLLLPFYEKFRELIPPELRDLVSFDYWPSQELEVTKEKINQANCLIIHGSDQTIKQIAELKNTNQIVLGFGHKISFILCAFNENFQNNLDYWVSLIAEDLFAFLQRGCLSAQVIYCVAEPEHESDVLKFCHKLNNKLEKFDWQMQPFSAFEKFHFTEKNILNKNNELIGNHIIYSKNQAFEYMPINGLVWVKPLKENELNNLDFIPNNLIDKIACIGHNLPVRDIQKVQSKLNYNLRFSDLGFMQKTCLFWLQDPSIVFI